MVVIDKIIDVEEGKTAYTMHNKVVAKQDNLAFIC